MKKLFTAVTLISQFAFASPGVSLDGTYNVKLKIADKVFNDILALKAAKPEGVINVDYYNDGVAGEMTVPGMFTSPVTGHAYCERYVAYCELNFEITANENGGSYKVFYAAFLKNEEYQAVRSGRVAPHFAGQATLEDGSLLGTFEAELVNP